MATGYGARQVFDLPEPKPLIVTEHRAHRCRCGKCGAQTTGLFPEGVTAPVQYGGRIMAVVVYLPQYHLVPEDRLAELMADLFGAKLVAATIARMSRGCARRFQRFVDVVCERVKTARVKPMDETGFRIGGKTQWLHIASTALLTFYRVSARRGSLLAGVIGIEKEDWARKMQRLLRRACHTANLARDRGPRGRPPDICPGDTPWPRGASLKPSLIALFERSYDTIVGEGIAFHEAPPPLAAKRRGRRRRRIGHNLLLRLEGRKEDVLRFLANATVPFTNNQAERDGRMMKLKQKISGGLRSEEGGRDFAVIRSFISTAKKQGWNVIQALMQNPETLIERLRTA